MSSYHPVSADPALAGTSREAILLKEVEDGNSSPEENMGLAANRGVDRQSKWKSMSLMGAILVLGLVVYVMSDSCRMRIFRGSGLLEVTQLEAASRNLKSVKSREDADKMVAEAMHKAKEERLQQHQLHKLGVPPALRHMAGSTASNTVTVGQYFDAEKLAVEARKEEAHDIVWTNKAKAQLWGGGEVQQAHDFRQAFCVFNAAETVDSLGATGIDVESLVRTCPEPRNDISSFACSVNAETLAEMVGTAATWLSSAVSTCDTFPNVGAECAQGVAGIVGALGEIAASGTLAMTSCKEFPLAGFKADQYNMDGKINSRGEMAPRMSQIGNHGPPERRLFMGGGIGAIGVQCGVDVGFIVDNIYNTIFYIQQATQLKSCSRRVRYGPYSYLTGVPEAACALDISGAIAWISQIATFVQQLISHCPDILELPTLCGSSATGLLSSAAQIATWGSQVSIACGESESVAVISRVIAFQEDYGNVSGREVAFVKLCTHALQGFNVDCTWVSTADDDDDVDLDGREVPQVTLVGPYEGLLLAEAEIKENGLLLPGFEPFTYLKTIRRVHGTGARRLEKEIEEAIEEADKKWDPVNHPKMRALRKAMKDLYAMRRNLTGEDSQHLQATRANLQERLHLIEPALQEYSSKWSIENLDTC